jgi:hypothetical protein
MLDKEEVLKIFCDSWQLIGVTKETVKEIVVQSLQAFRRHLPDSHNLHTQHAKGKNYVFRGWGFFYFIWMGRDWLYMVRRPLFGLIPASDCRC